MAWLCCCREWLAGWHTMACLPVFSQAVLSPPFYVPAWCFCLSGNSAYAAQAGGRTDKLGQGEGTGWRLGGRQGKWWAVGQVAGKTDGNVLRLPMVGTALSLLPPHPTPHTPPTTTLLTRLLNLLLHLPLPFPSPRRLEEHLFTHELLPERCRCASSARCFPAHAQHTHLGKNSARTAHARWRGVARAYGGAGVRFLLPACRAPRRVCGV